MRTAFNTDRLTRIAMDSLQSWALPNGYRWVAAGEIESRQESFGGFGGAILLATFGILTVLILEFKTFKSMLIVASVIPLGAIGGLLPLALQGSSRYSPLAIVIIGGPVSSLLLSRLVTPVLYKLVPPGIAPDAKTATATHAVPVGAALPA